ncbi:hypothetical protein AG1IA_10460 [Rhizoctonia solani AG-1 IA]|uniref:Uncharacterized protein n=1 Tax=Thanatephorus cucumeris (strain AG1-IA) TaxID=983506 RepID=L8WC20_THACA|nr:hypothetical protein AG1IA_10460 [Rhizoctonia solani AG-1 IA]
MRNFTRLKEHFWPSIEFFSVASCLVKLSVGDFRPGSKVTLTCPPKSLFRRLLSKPHNKARRR